MKRGRNTVAAWSILPGLAAIVALFFTASCEWETSPANPNSPPNTSLANIPLPGDTLFALVTLHWDGEDDDGFIAGYEYRYVTYHLTPDAVEGECPPDSVVQMTCGDTDNGVIPVTLCAADSVVQEWRRTTETSLTIAFESSADLNFQKVQVRAVDNEGAPDPDPAERCFYTEKTFPPETEILIPSQDEQRFVIREVTDWFLGIPLTFTARDRDGDVVEYGWTVDHGDTTWTSDTTLYIAPDRFPEPLGGRHVIQVTSRDNTNLVDPVGDTVAIYLTEPIFDRGILVVDETLETSFPPGVNASDAQVDSFYADIFQPDTMWDYFTDGMPPREILGRYRLVIWHADNTYGEASEVHKLPQHVDDIMDYLNVGGDFIMSGWRILKSFAPTENFPRSFGEGTFIHDYLHIITVDETILFGDFTGATGVGPHFSDVNVDSLKLAEAFPYYGKLAQINIIPSPAGFTDIVYSYQNADDSPYVEYRGQPCGLRYYGTTFDAVVLGFPIFFIVTEDARTLAREILESMGYIRTAPDFSRVGQE
ncbi:MAG: hypothetical protein ACE5LH_00445 [Fidelibacterota bacterium]